MRIPWLTNNEDKKNLVDLFEYTARVSGVSRETAAIIVLHFLEGLSYSLARGKYIRIPGFGLFGIRYLRRKDKYRAYPLWVCSAQVHGLIKEMHAGFTKSYDDPVQVREARAANRKMADHGSNLSGDVGVEHDRKHWRAIRTALTNKTAVSRVQRPLASVLSEFRGRVYRQAARDGVVPEVDP